MSDSEDDVRRPRSPDVEPKKKSGAWGAILGLLIAGGIFGGQYLWGKNNIKNEAERLVNQLVGKPVKSIEFGDHPKYDYSGKAITEDGETLEFVVQTKSKSSTEKEVYVACRPTRQKAESTIRAEVESKSGKKIVSLSLTPSGLFYTGEGKMDSGEKVLISCSDTENNGHPDVEFRWELK